MEIRNLYLPFELELWEKDHYEARPHKNTFFEMVFVLEGTGIQWINQYRLPFAKDKLFLIFPQDSHGFEIQSSSKLFFIRFNSAYLNQQSKDWVKRLEFIFHNHNHLPGCILKTVADKPLVRALVEALIREHHHQFPHTEEVVQQLINTIITIAARNISLITPINIDKPKSETAMLMINYIHQHIYEPSKLRVEELAKHFNLSATYLSEYFKIQTGSSLQEYVMNYKIKIIEMRLMHTNLNISEIVYELGFSDASHLNRIFKKYRGISPSEFKRRVKQT